MRIKGVGFGSAVTLLATMAVASCHSPGRTVAIGFAFTYRLKPAMAVANDEISHRWRGRGPQFSVVYDSAVTGDPADVEVRRAERLAAVPGIVAVVGHSGSRASLAAAPVYNEAGIVQVTPNSTSRLLESAGPWTFNLVPDDSVEGVFIGEFVAERLRALRVTIYYENDEYGTGLRDGVVAALGQRGVEVLDRVPVDLTSDFRTLVAASLKRGVPDVVVVAGRQFEAGTIARLMREHGMRRAVVAGDGALVLPALADIAGPAADSIYLVAYWTQDAPDSLSRAFVARYRRVAGMMPESPDAIVHDALMVVAEAVHEVGSNRAAVRQYLAELGRKRPPFPGVTGPIAFTSGARPRLVMTHLMGGRVSRVTGP
jgi:branched-chain amino acid transport system substrate-binding protein